MQKIFFQRTSPQEFHKKGSTNSFKIPLRAPEVETFETRVARLNQSVTEDSNGDFVPVINWMNRRVEVFLEHMGRGNFAVLFRVVESSLVGHDIEDVLGTLDGQI